MTILAIINKDTNLVENISVDDRPISEIILPDPYFVINLETTIAVIYSRDHDTKEVLSEESIGQGSIGFTWDGTKLIGPQPKPLVV
jgi:hypothetical protein